MNAKKKSFSNYVQQKKLYFFEAILQLFNTPNHKVVINFTKFMYFNLKFFTELSEILDESGIWKKKKSRIQRSKSTGSRIQIRNTIFVSGFRGHFNFLIF
jgi:hypothetical protein